MKKVFARTAWFVFALPSMAWATQAHGAPEGIYAHQFSHLFFLVSMVILIYWLRQRGLVQRPGWRLIQFAALFFMLWNANVVAVHFLDEQACWVLVETVGDRHVEVSSPLGFGASVFYYFGKMDHLLCVPAMAFLYLGLRRLGIDAEGGEGGK